ncbi:MAG: YggS family pyridoxal phosphate-dependent enzyme [Bacteroidota bacterium]
MLARILEELKVSKTQLIAVSKTKPEDQILAAYHQGVRNFGENRVQEVVNKQAALPQDIQWHFIGHLQSKKVKSIAPFIALIHSIDSAKILVEVNKQAARQERIIDVLFQFKIAEEESKYGFDLATATQLLQSSQYSDLKHVRVVGVMGMATFTSDQDQVRTEFKTLHRIFRELKTRFFAEADHFKEVSMGMSGDYQIAIEEGSTMVRIGSLIFGHR